MDDRQAMTVGQVARRSGVAISTLHFYEKNGLITGWRTTGNQRRYPRGILRRIAIIRIAQRAGLPLAVIKDYMKKLPPGPITPEIWHHLSQEWHDILDERITSLLQLRNQLESCIGCGCLSLSDCPLRNPEDVLAQEGAGARLLLNPPARGGKAPARLKRGPKA